MFFAVIGDIMSNFSGLRTVLDTLADEGIHRVLHTGNVCGGPDGVRECVALLRERNVLCVQGRRDRAVARLRRRSKDFADDEETARTHAALGSAALEYLNGLPRKRIFVEEGLRVLLCHGAVDSAGETLDAGTPLARFRREREAAAADIVVCGGAALPFAFNVEQTLFACPGTMIAEDGVARYTLVDMENAPWSARSVTLG